MTFNEDTSFIEYNVEQPTQDFVTNFDTIGGTTDVVLVTVDGVLTDTPESSYTVQQINHNTWRVTPEVPVGSVVRLYRVTNIDEMMHVFTAGAKFIARNMDSNFKQIRHSQQEVRDGFSKLSDDTYALIDGLDEAIGLARDAAQDAQDAAAIAQGAADTVNTIIVGGKVSAANVLDGSGAAQQQVNYNGGSKWYSRVGGYKLHERVVLTNGDIVKSTVDGNTNDPNVDMTGWVKTNSASQIVDESGKSQQEVNSILFSDVDYVEKSKVSTPQGQMYFTNKNPTFDPLAIGYIGWKQGDRVSEFSLNKNVDDLMLVKYGWFAPVESPSTMVQASNFRDASGNIIDPATTIAAWGTTNPYFSDEQVGFKFDLVFSGVGLISRHNGNEQGGMFKVTIDGVVDKNITTYAVPNTTHTIEIVNGLPHGTYTATFEYIGHDPNNTASSQRGYFKYDAAGTVQQSSGYVISGNELIGSTSKELVITNIIEFAINAKPAGTALAKDWIPSHSQVLGATVTNSRVVLIDGVNYGNDFSTIPLDSIKKCSQILIIQNYTAYCTADSSKQYPLWNGVLIHRFDSDGLTVTNNTNGLLRDVEFGNGYMGMVSSRGTITPNFITDNGTSGTITGTTEGWHPKFSKNVLFYNKETKKSVAVKVLSIVESSNLNKPYTPTEPTRLTDRTDGFGKIYWNLFDNGQTLPSGSVLSSSHNIFMSANNNSL